MKERKWGGEYHPEDGFPVVEGHYFDPIFGISLTLIVIKTPKGPAPENIRQAWAGEVLEGWPNAELRFDFLNGERKYIVPREHAMSVLRNSDKAYAARWFEDNWPPSVEALDFGVDELQVIKGYDE